MSRSTMTVRKNPCAPEKRRVVNRKPLTKDVREYRRSGPGASYRKCPWRGLQCL
ncbi:Uncharacterised protein [Mycobacteroides abscessus subsp. abscessus]|nr:Uncharacterised protein [Mycobacteroides abscessus subsp. abscessus]